MKKAIAWTREHIASYGGDPSYLGSRAAPRAVISPRSRHSRPAIKEYQPGFEDADTTVAACVPFYGVYDLAGVTGNKAAVAMRDQFLAPRVFRKDAGAAPGGLRAGVPDHPRLPGRT